MMTFRERTKTLIERKYALVYPFKEIPTGFTPTGFTVADDDELKARRKCYLRSLYEGEVRAETSRVLLYMLPLLHRIDLMGERLSRMERERFSIVDDSTYNVEVNEDRMFLIDQGEYSFTARMSELWLIRGLRTLESYFPTRDWIMGCEISECTLIESWNVDGCV